MGRRLPIAERLSDRGLKAKIQLYVRNEPGTDHKCGSCAMRVPFSGDRARCTVMFGEISLAHGSCLYWTGGSASEREDISEMRLSKRAALYVERRGAINCSTCRFVRPEGSVSSGSFCGLWETEVGPGDRCLSWSSPPRLYDGGGPLSERWDRALDEGVGLAFTDRYNALGIPQPDPMTMCKGQCEGTGWVPVCEDEQEEPFRSLWQQAEAEGPTDDGWHFVPCPTCEGTGLAQPHEAHVAELAETGDTDSPVVRAAKARVAALLRRS